eukprot:3172735-Rhodomonas_salina.1
MVLAQWLYALGQSPAIGLRAARYCPSAYSYYQPTRCPVQSIREADSGSDLLACLSLARLGHPQPLSQLSLPPPPPPLGRAHHLRQLLLPPFNLFAHRVAQYRTLPSRSEGRYASAHRQASSTIRFSDLSTGQRLASQYRTAHSA